MTKVKREIPVGAVQGAATPTGASEAPADVSETSAVATEDAEVPNPEKVIGQEIMEAIAVASGNLNGTAIEGANLTEMAAAITAAGGGGDYFDPSLSQYKEGLVIYFDETASRAKNVEVGTDGNSTICVTVPAGIIDGDGKVVLNRVFNVYLSTLRKSISVTDENGEPALDGKGAQIIVDGSKNAIWREMQGYRNPSQLLTAVIGRAFICRKVEHAFGPSNYVGERPNRRPTGHRLTSLPLFEEISI